MLLSFGQVCDSDTMLDPASSVEMVKVLEEDPMVGGVGGDVQVNANNFSELLDLLKFLETLDLFHI